MKTTITIKTENEFAEFYIWLLQRIKGIKKINSTQGRGCNPEKYLGQKYLNALLDVKKMALMENPLLKLLESDPKQLLK